VTKLTTLVTPAYPAPDNVPVALFVYRRHRQLARTLKCLHAGGVKQLYVFSDGPKSNADAGDVAEVRSVLQAVDWIEAIVVAREENAGLSASIRTGLDSLFERHEAVIVIEDDVCVAPEFYDYACQALEHYRGSGLVAGITGLRYPFERDVLDTYPYDTFLSPRFSSWAWATWRERWMEFCFDTDSLRRQIGSSTSFVPRHAGADMPGMIHDAVVTGSLTGAWDVVCATNMLLRGQYLVTPTWNMVENTGLSEGTHFTEAPPWELHWETDRKPSMQAIRFAPLATDESVLEPYRRFFAPRGSLGVLGQARAAAARMRETQKLRRAWKAL
jgi:hypothetical protein